MQLSIVAITIAIFFGTSLSALPLENRAAAESEFDPDTAALVIDWEKKRSEDASFDPDTAALVIDWEKKRKN